MHSNFLKHNLQLLITKIFCPRIWQKADIRFIFHQCLEYFLRKKEKLLFCVKKDRLYKRICFFLFIRSIYHYLRGVHWRSNKHNDISSVSRFQGNKSLDMFQVVDFVRLTTTCIGVNVHLDWLICSKLPIK